MFNFLKDWFRKYNCTRCRDTGKVLGGDCVYCKKYPIQLYSDDLQEENSNLTSLVVELVSSVSVPDCDDDEDIIEISQMETESDVSYIQPPPIYSEPVVHTPSYESSAQSSSYSESPPCYTDSASDSDTSLSFSSGGDF